MRLGDLYINISNPLVFHLMKKFASENPSFVWQNFEMLSREAILLDCSIPIFLFEDESEIDVSDDLSN